MSRNIVEHFSTVHLRDVELRTNVAVAAGTGVAETVGAMVDADKSCAVITDADRIVGIFTERDITTKVVAAPERWTEAVDAFMTTDPVVISADSAAVDALHVLNTRPFRNLPIVDADGRYCGTITHYDLIRLASAHLRSHTDIGHENSAEHSLMYVDLSGVEPHPALQIAPASTIAEAIELMIDAGTGLVSVVTERGAVIGEFTEHDIFTKIACRVESLDDEVVGAWMTEVMAAVPPSTSVADALHLMADIGHRYLVLINENDHALGVLTFRDIAGYFETALAVTSASS